MPLAVMVVVLVVMLVGVIVVVLVGGGISVGGGGCRKLWCRGSWCGCLAVCGLQHVSVVSL